MPFCAQCGKQIEQTDTFCASCGAKTSQGPSGNTNTARFDRGFAPVAATTTSSTDGLESAVQYATYQVYAMIVSIVLAIFIGDQLGIIVSAVIAAIVNFVGVNKLKAGEAEAGKICMYSAIVTAILGVLVLFISKYLLVGSVYFAAAVLGYLAAQAAEKAN